MASGPPELRPGCGRDDNRPGGNDGVRRNLRPLSRWRTVSVALALVCLGAAHLSSSSSSWGVAVAAPSSSNDKSEAPPPPGLGDADQLSQPKDPQTTADKVPLPEKGASLRRLDLGIMKRVRKIIYESPEHKNKGMGLRTVTFSAGKDTWERPALFDASVEDIVTHLLLVYKEKYYASAFFIHLFTPLRLRLIGRRMYARQTKAMQEEQDSETKTQEEEDRFRREFFDIGEFLVLTSVLKRITDWRFDGYTYYRRGDYTVPERLDLDDLGFLHGVPLNAARIIRVLRTGKKPDSLLRFEKELELRGIKSFHSYMYRTNLMDLFMNYDIWDELFSQLDIMKAYHNYWLKENNPQTNPNYPNPLNFLPIVPPPKDYALQKREGSKLTAPRCPTLVCDMRRTWVENEYKTVDIELNDRDALRFISVGGIDQGFHSTKPPKAIKWIRDLLRYNEIERTAQKMKKWADENKPDFVQNLGGTFPNYGTVSAEDTEHVKTFRELFLKNAEGDPMVDIPWFNVLGEKDASVSPSSSVRLGYTDVLSDKWNTPNDFYTVEFNVKTNMTLQDGTVETQNFKVVMVVLNTWALLNGSPVVNNVEAWNERFGWVSKALHKAAMTKPDWLIVAGHHPILGTGKYGELAQMQQGNEKMFFSSQMSTEWFLHQLFQHYYVDMYFSGRDHIMEHVLFSNKKVGPEKEEFTISYVNNGSATRMHDSSLGRGILGKLWGWTVPVWCKVMTKVYPKWKPSGCQPSSTDRSKSDFFQDQSGDNEQEVIFADRHISNTGFAGVHVTKDLIHIDFIDSMTGRQVGRRISKGSNRELRQTFFKSPEEKAEDKVKRDKLQLETYMGMMRRELEELFDFKKKHPIRHARNQQRVGLLQDLLGQINGYKRFLKPMENLKPKHLKANPEEDLEGRVRRVQQALKDISKMFTDLYNQHEAQLAQMKQLMDYEDPREAELKDLEKKLYDTKLQITATRVSNDEENLEVVEKQQLAQLERSLEELQQRYQQVENEMQFGRPHDWDPEKEKKWNKLKERHEKQLNVLKNTIEARRKEQESLNKLLQKMEKMHPDDQENSVLVKELKVEQQKLENNIKELEEQYNADVTDEKKQKDDDEDEDSSKDDDEPVEKRIQRLKDSLNYIHHLENERDSGDPARFERAKQPLYDQGWTDEQIETFMSSKQNYMATYKKLKGEEFEFESRLRRLAAEVEPPPAPALPPSGAASRRLANVDTSQLSAAGKGAPMSAAEREQALHAFDQSLDSIVAVFQKGNEAQKKTIMQVIRAMGLPQDEIAEVLHDVKSIKEQARGLRNEDLRAFMMASRQTNGNGMPPALLEAPRRRLEGMDMEEGLAFLAALPDKVARMPRDELVAYVTDQLNKFDEHADNPAALKAHEDSLVAEGIPIDFIRYAFKNRAEIREHLHEIPEYEPKMDRLRRLSAVDESPPISGAGNLNEMLKGMNSSLKRELVKAAIKIMPLKLKQMPPDALRSYLTEKLDKYEELQKSNDTDGIKTFRQDLREDGVQDDQFDFILKNREQIRTLLPYVNSARLRRLSATTSEEKQGDDQPAPQRKLIEIFYPEIPEFDPGPRDECRNAFLQSLALAKMEMPGVVESYHRQCYDIHLQNIKREQFRSVENAQPPRTFSWQVEENLVHMSSRWDFRKTFIQVFDEMYKQFNSVGDLYMSEDERVPEAAETPEELADERETERQIEEGHNDESTLIKSVTRSALSDQNNPQTQED